MQLSDQVHWLEVMKGSYVYLILGEEPILVDTGMSSRSLDLIKALREIGLQPKDLAHIVLTHQDVDHIGNAKFLQKQSDAILWAPKEEVPFIHGEQTGPGIRKILSSIVRVDRPHVQHTYAEGQMIGDLEIIPAPGHTIGHVCMRYKDVLLAGDLVTSRKGKLNPAPGILTWDKAALKSSLRSVGSLTFDWVCPAHGKPVKRGNLWDALLS